MTKRSFRDVLMANPIPFRDPHQHMTGCSRNSNLSASATSETHRDDTKSKKLGENRCPEYTDSALRSDVLAISQMVRGADPSSLTKSILQSGSTNDIVN